jgi:hypothetical protein
MNDLIEVETDHDIDQYISDKLNKSNLNKFIELVHPDLNLKYNSLNVAIGKPGTSKTTTFMKTMIKTCMYPNDYHMIIYASDTDADDTVLSLMNDISIPMIHVTYDRFIEKLEELIKLKQRYWKALRENDMKTAKQIAHSLFIKKLSPNIQTMIFCDDAGWMFDKKSPMKKYLCKLRHLQCTFWLNKQIWKSLESEIKSLITSCYICRGYSSQQLSMIYRQLSIADDSYNFRRKYFQLQGYEKLFVDNRDGIIKIVS